MSSEYFFERLVDSQIIGAMIGIMLHIVQQKSRKKSLSKSREKELDKEWIEKIFKVLQEILKILNLNSVQGDQKKQIPVDLLTQLELGTQLAPCNKKKLDNIREECLYYNEMDIVKNSKSMSSTESSEIESRKRRLITEGILSTVAQIKASYAKP